ncbi:MAG: hypothetical protein JSW01_01905, partial [Candidatus Bathyarchaeota archaeon]
IWINNPSPEMIEYSSSTLGTEILSQEEWKELVERSGLRDTVIKIYKVDPLKELIARIRLLGLGKMLNAWFKLFSLYTKNPAIGDELRKELSMPRDSFQYMGYGIYTGKK